MQGFGIFFYFCRFLGLKPRDLQKCKKKKQTLTFRREEIGETSSESFLKCDDLERKDGDDLERKDGDA